MAAVVLATLALVGACGGRESGANSEVASLGTDPGIDGSGPDAAPDGTAPTDSEEAMLAYTECMRDRGVEMPDPGPAADGGPAVIAMDVDPGDDDFQAAATACEPLMEAAFGAIEPDPEEEAEMRENMLAYAECMREQGIDMPDPVFSEKGGIEVNDARPAGEASHDEFMAAAEECGGGSFGVTVGSAAGGG